MSHAISIKNIAKIFPGNQHAISKVSFHITRHKFVSLIGPSGCGKSTLLSIIAGVEKQSAGSVLIDEKEIEDRRGRTGYMLQNSLLLPWMTVEENTILGLVVQGVNKDIALKKARRLLSDFGLSTSASFYPDSLSVGMAQRVAFLRTILFNKSLLLLDEPFGALDMMTRFSAQKWLMDVWKTYRSTALLVTHDIREAILLSDRILVMSRRPSRIIADISVDIPRPRTLKHLQGKKALDLEKKLIKMLMGQKDEF